MALIRFSEGSLTQKRVHDHDNGSDVNLSLCRGCGPDIKAMLAPEKELGSALSPEFFR